MKIDIEVNIIGNEKPFIATNSTDAKLMLRLLISGAAASNFRLEKTWKFGDRDRGVPDRSRTVINDSLVCECKLLEVLRRSANSEVRKH